LHFSQAGQTAAVKLLVLLCLPAFAFTIPACSLFNSKKPDSPENKSAAEGPELIGRIASIPADKHFVLIQSYGSWNIEAGTILTTRGLEKRTANLLVTGEKLGQFAAADIQSGSVEIGDAVYSQHVPKSAETTAATGKEAELPENQQKEEIGNVQKNN
jgi:hypothetical protein